MAKEKAALAASKEARTISHNAAIDGDGRRNYFPLRVDQDANMFALNFVLGKKTSRFTTFENDKISRFMTFHS